jgi:hypothetical protein
MESGPKHSGYSLVLWDSYHLPTPLPPVISTVPTSPEMGGGRSDPQALKGMMGLQIQQLRGVLGCEFALWLPEESPSC